MAINLQNIAADATTILGKVPQLTSDLTDLAFVLNMIPATQPLALELTAIITKVSVLSAVQGDLPPFLAAGQKIATDFEAALAAKPAA